MIKTCDHNCKHAYQDAKHGPGKRVHNRKGGGKKSGITGWRCTVCGKDALVK